MKARRILVLVCLWTCTAASASPPDEAWHEPVRNGKRLTEWIDLMLDPDGGVRLNAASVLMSFGPEGYPAVPALAMSLKDELIDTRIYAAEALRGIGPKAEEAVPALVDALKDNDPSVRTNSARALFAISPAHARESALALASIVEKKHDGDRIRAIQGLEEIGPKSTAGVPALKKLLTSPALDPSVKSAAEAALRRIEPPDESPRNQAPRS
jgi:HEAT repeat protein